MGDFTPIEVGTYRKLLSVNPNVKVLDVGMEKTQHLRCVTVYVIRQLTALRKYFVTLDEPLSGKGLMAEEISFQSIMNLHYSNSIQSFCA